MAAGLFWCYFFVGCNWKRGIVECPHPLYLTKERVNGSEVKYNRRFLWNHSYMITSGHDPSLEVGFSHPPLAESFGCTGGKLAFNTWREYNSCRSSMTRRVAVFIRA